MFGLRRLCGNAILEICSISNSDSGEACPNLDLNLIPYLVALDETRNVSRAGDLLGVSQPRVSAALGRLREHFGDPLFVRTSRGMEPTPRALALVPAARDALAQIRRGLVAPHDFDPATDTTHPFRSRCPTSARSCSCPGCCRSWRGARRARTCVRCRCRTRRSSAGWRRGAIDLAVGYFPDLGGNNFFQQRLFTHRFICLMRRGHPLAGKPLTLEQFLACGHAVVRAEGRSQEVLEQHLAKARLQRRAVLETPHFMSLPFILGRTDLIATVPHAIGYAYVAEHASITLVEPPLPLPRFDLRQHWHRKYHNDPRTAWLRGMVADLFNDALDEWPK